MKNGEVCFNNQSKVGAAQPQDIGVANDAKVNVVKARNRMKEMAAAGVGQTAEIYGQVQH